MLITVFDEFKKEFDERFGSNVHIIDWALHMDEATPHIHERHVFDVTNDYGEIEPKQEAALKELGFELPQPDKPRSKSNNRKIVFDSVCRAMYLDICKRHGLELDKEPSYGGRKYLEKQDYIRMKQKEEITEQRETIEQQIDIVNANRLDIAKQSIKVRENDRTIQAQEEKIARQDKEFCDNSDRIFKQGDLIEEQEKQLEQLSLRIEDVENLIDEVSGEAYDKAVDQVAGAVAKEIRKADIKLVESSKQWIQQPERKASRKEKSYALDRLDGVIKKIENAMQKTVIQIKQKMLQPEKKETVVNEIKKQVKPSILKKLGEKKAELAQKENERKQEYKNHLHSLNDER